MNTLNVLPNLVLENGLEEIPELTDQHAIVHRFDDPVGGGHSI